jgi:hypothetical protein
MHSHKDVYSKNLTGRDGKFGTFPYYIISNEK